ncbi:hypothetical protein [Streptomyces sp. NPDC051286]|uniref:hypothetical protein n=1 Tax=Streptomyces sp. NPDC051286 TaxID=3365647 RepID=UPI0037B2DB70
MEAELFSDALGTHSGLVVHAARADDAGEQGPALMVADQRREMTRPMADAGIVPKIAPVRSGEAELNRITGAQTPSGVPVSITAPLTERARSGGASSRGRRGRPVRAVASLGPAHAGGAPPPSSAVPNGRGDPGAVPLRRS